MLKPANLFKNSVENIYEVKDESTISRNENKADEVKCMNPRWRTIFNLKAEPTTIIQV